MHATICTLSIVALLASTASAQTSSPTTPQPSPGAAAQASEATKLTGCLREAPGTPPEGAPAEKNAANKFTLEVMKPRAGMPPSSVSPETTRVPQAPQTAGAARASDKETYTLMAMGGVDLSKHVNHLVELTGTKAPAASMSSASGAAASASAHPMFHVTALKMVSASCTQTSQ